MGDPGIWTLHSALVAVAITIPFVFYTILWRKPQLWVQFCHNADPSHRMAQVSHALKVLQIMAVASVTTLSRPPWFCPVLLLLGQYLNFRVYELLGEAGVYYGASFGKKLPWVEKFPFGYIRDPQYVGSICSLLGVACWVPWRFVFLWVAEYLYMMVLEGDENPSVRSSKIH